ncbi:TPA: hypothetical protein I8271_005479 [Kluyvera intermedia]|uniref:Uncharacterized protein n=1 Tax=Kluyvera intermedia TaxID=61648 RepID=A0A9P3TD52_KLUIN|nr:hypothetical protein [Phytobacter ursingii]HAT2606747.1 hypothetical protein [Kluyvera intermedia]HAT2683488.1 hypothetical protein [Kluyvera intermedia]HAT2700011.1 hypothetical protein [Kluyvera intermedia]HAT2710967.1 hypothetical protein [Kluyvera intermedia]HAT2998162.1 hypothetical protein [Kluyvera intermedia]
MQKAIRRDGLFYCRLKTTPAGRGFQQVLTLPHCFWIFNLTRLAGTYFLRVLVSRYGGINAALMKADFY